MDAPNAAQIADWNGAVGERWAAEQLSLDALIHGFGVAALAAAKPAPGERVLDIGCGCGETALELARAVGPTGSVLGVDVSGPMLRVARSRAEGLANLSFLQADASQATLPAGFSLLFSRFGVMFFDRPVEAFARIATALTPEGRLAFVCWREAGLNPWATVPAKAALAAANLPPPQPTPRAPGPFAFAEADYVSEILAQAGFRNINLAPVEAPMRLGGSPAEAAMSALKVGPASRIAREAGPEAFPNLLGAIETALAPHAAPSGEVILTGRTWLVTANRG